MMLVHHLFSCFPDYVEKYKVSSVILTMNQVLALSYCSKVCVAVFVFLSAYGMAASLEKKTETDRNGYIVKRYQKLLSGFFLIYLISIATCFLRSGGIKMYFGEGRAKGIFYMLIDAAGMANFLGTPTYNETWWYMSVAILLVFMIPVYVKLYEMFGVSMVVAGAMLSYFGVDYTAFTTYTFAALLGICAEKDGLFRNPDRFSDKKGILAGFVWNAVLLGLVSMIRYKWGYEYWMDGVIALFLVRVICILVDAAGWNLKILVFIGKNSMNIFLVHTLIFEYYFTDAVYFPGHWILITAVLVGSSLVVSLAVESIKDILFLLIQKKKNAGNI